MTNARDMRAMVNLYLSIQCRLVDFCRLVPNSSYTSTTLASLCRGGRARRITARARRRGYTLPPRAARGRIARTLRCGSAPTLTA
jgi:hypothetical protein